MNWMTRFLMGQMLLLDENKGNEGGGGAPDPVKALTERLEKMEKENAELKSKLAPPSPDDKSLADKARLEREERDKKALDSKSLQSALEFNIKSQDFLKNNASLLPKGIEAIFAKAETEKYENAIEKASAIKVSLVQEFFALQANLDLLTAVQKSMLEEFELLTNNKKQERVQQIYDMVFEPTLEASRKIKKAEAVQKGLAPANNAVDAYEKRLTQMSQKHYGLERKNA